MNTDQSIDTGDHVRHTPSGEEWLVAYVRGDRLVACGWPPGSAALADFVLLKKASPAERLKLLEELAKSSMGNDPRVQEARRALELSSPINLQAAAMAFAASARRAGFVVTISQSPRLPLAMGNHADVVEVREVRS